MVGSTLVKLRSGMDPDESNEIEVTTLPSDKALRTPNMRRSPQQQIIRIIEGNSANKLQHHQQYQVFRPIVSGNNFTASGAHATNDFRSHIKDNINTQIESHSVQVKGNERTIFPNSNSINSSTATLNNALGTSPLIPKLNNAINSIKYNKDQNEPDLFV